MIRQHRGPVDRENETWLEREARAQEDTSFGNTFSEVQSAFNRDHLTREQYDVLLAAVVGRSPS